MLGTGYVWTTVVNAVMVDMGVPPALDISCNFYSLCEFLEGRILVWYIARMENARLLWVGRVIKRHKKFPVDSDNKANFWSENVHSLLHYLPPSIDEFQSKEFLICTHRSSVTPTPMLFLELRWKSSRPWEEHPWDCLVDLWDAAVHRFCVSRRSHL